MHRVRLLLAMAMSLSLGSSALAADQAPQTQPSPGKMAVVYLVLLKKGPAWSAAETPEAKAIQEAHMANIRSLWQAKKMIIAGPFGDDGEWRGVFIFQAASMEEAQSLANSDPAIKAGRLVAEIHPWWVERAALPEAGAYCSAKAP
jgi:uncharacterized protein